VLESHNFVIQNRKKNKSVEKKIKTFEINESYFREFSKKMIIWEKSFFFRKFKPHIDPFVRVSFLAARG